MLKKVAIFGVGFGTGVFGTVYCIKRIFNSPIVKQVIFEGMDASIKQFVDRCCEQNSDKQSNTIKYSFNIDKNTIKPSFEIDNIVFGSRYDADNVLYNMQTEIDAYGFVSILDLYDLAGITTCDYTANEYGWTDLHTAKVVKVRDGYVLHLPSVKKYERR